MTIEYFSVGVDVVSISRVEQLLHDYPSKFREYAFTSTEQQYCDDRYNPAEHYSVRWAAKEAYLKSTPGDTTIPPDAIEVSANGTSIRLRTEELSESRIEVLKQVQTSLSLTHSRPLDTGIAIAIQFK